MDKTMRNKVFVFMLAVLMLITSFFSMGFTTAKADSRELKFDQTNVMDDLRSAKNFNILNYPFYESLEPEMGIMNVVEYCYSFDILNQNEYGLYLYLYNPNGRKIDTSDGVNKVYGLDTFRYDCDTESIEESVSLSFNDRITSAT